MSAQRLYQVISHLQKPAGLLDGQLAIITGSGQGIGAETAKQFAAQGAKVVIADIDEEKATDIANEINKSSPAKAIAVAGDILDSAYHKSLVEKAAQFGQGKIHILVNNAGYTWDAVIHKTSNEQWDTMIAIHETAPFMLVRALAPYFRVNDGESRCVVNISSTAGLNGNAGQVNYSVGKAGIVGLTKTIAKEWGPQFGVRANTVAFGHIQTRLTGPKEEGRFVVGPGGRRVAVGIPTPGKGAPNRFANVPLRRPGEVYEAASVVLAVASPLFSYVSGQTIAVTGGS